MKLYARINLMRGTYHDGQLFVYWYHHDDSGYKSGCGKTYLLESGRSQALARKGYAQAYAAWLAGLVGSNGGGPVALAGLSFGAWITTVFTLRRPDQVERLALLSPAAWSAPLAWRLLKLQIMIALFPGERSARTSCGRATRPKPGGC